MTRLSGLLLAAFFQPIGNPYKWSGFLIEFWWESRGLYVTVKLCGVERRPLLSLSHHLTGYDSCVAHIKVYFTSSPLSDIFHESLACHLATLHPLIIELAWYYHLEPTSVKNYLIWRETCFLSNWLENGFKRKELLYNVWKFYTHSFSHWWATTLQIIKTGFSQYFSIGYKSSFHLVQSHIMVRLANLLFVLTLVS